MRARIDGFAQRSPDTGNAQFAGPGASGRSWFQRFVSDPFRQYVAQPFQRYIANPIGSLLKGTFSSNLTWTPKPNDGLTDEVVVTAQRGAAAANTAFLQTWQAIQMSQPYRAAQAFAGGWAEQGRSGSGVSVFNSPAVNAGIQTRQFFQEYRPIVRTLGGLQAIGGAAEALGGAALIGGGAATSETGVGIAVAAGGTWLLSNGFDNIGAGTRTALGGVPQPTNFNLALRAAGLSERNAALVEVGTNLAGGLGAAKIAQLAQTPRSASLGSGLVAAESIPINGATRTVPLGFEAESQFHGAALELRDALSASGVNDATIGVRGSSVTGSSFKTGAPFSPESDIDFFVESGQLTDGYKASRNIPGFIHPNKILNDYPLLSEWSQKWTGILGRDVTPGAFQPGTLPSHPAIVVK